MSVDRTTNVLVLDQGRGVWGAQRYLLRLAPLLAEHGVHLTLANPPSLESHIAWRDAGLAALELDLPLDRSIRSGNSVSPRKAVREAWGICRVVRDISTLAVDGGFDAILANSHWIHLDAALAGKRAGIPAILHLHEESVPGFGSRLRALAVQRASTTVAVSNAVAQGLPDSVRDSVLVVPNGIDTEALQPGHTAARTFRDELGLDDSAVIALAMTRLDPVKRIEDLINAVASLGDPRVTLVIAGSTSGFPDYEAEVRALAAQAAPGRVVFCGHRSDTASMLASADLVVHAGVVEGMPLGLLEAQSCGVPVIAYSVAGVPECVVHGVTGLLVPPTDVAALTRALGELVSDSARRVRMGKAGREQVLAEHRIELQAARNAEIIETAVELARSGVRA